MAYENSHAPRLLGTFRLEKLGEEQGELALFAG